MHKGKVIEELNQLFYLKMLLKKGFLIEEFMVVSRGGWNYSPCLVAKIRTSAEILKPCSFGIWQSRHEGIRRRWLKTVIQGVTAFLAGARNCYAGFTWIRSAGVTACVMRV